MSAAGVSEAGVGVWEGPDRGMALGHCAICHGLVKISSFEICCHCSRKYGFYGLPRSQYPAWARDLATVWAKRRQWERDTLQLVIDTPIDALPIAADEYASLDDWYIEQEELPGRMARAQAMLGIIEDALTAKQWRAVKYRLGMEYTLMEAGAAMGISHQTVSRHVEKAREKARGLWPNL
jgi:hypothetical protein